MGQTDPKHRFYIPSGYKVNCPFWLMIHLFSTLGCFGLQALCITCVNHLSPLWNLWGNSTDAQTLGIRQSPDDINNLTRTISKDVATVTFILKM